jgi:chromosome segregation ATPase
MKLQRSGLFLVLALFLASALWSQSISEPTPQERYDALKLKYDSLEATYQQLLLKSQGYEQILREVLESSVRLTQLLLKARSDLGTSQEDLQALTLSSEALAAKLQTINEELAATKLQLADYEAKLASLQSELADLRQKLQDSEAKLAEISTRYDVLLTDFQGLTARFQTLSAKYDELLTQYSAALAKIVDLSSQLQAALKQIDILQGDLDKVKKEMTQIWLTGFGWGALGTSVIFTILYFTVLPHAQ